MEDVEEVAKYERVILSIRDEYFKVNDRDDPNLRFPNKKAQILADEKIAGKQKEARG